jgi:hypothetical protein
MNAAFVADTALFQRAAFAYASGQGWNKIAGEASVQRNPADVERLASDSIELSTRHSFPHWLTHGTILPGWARSALGDTAEGIA